MQTQHKDVLQQGYKNYIYVVSWHILHSSDIIPGFSAKQSQKQIWGTEQISEYG